MTWSNDSGRRRAARARAAGCLAVALTGAVAAVVGCGGPETASFQRDVRIRMSHDPPESAPAGETFLLGVTVSSSHPLPAGSAHLWYDSAGERVRVPLQPVAGSDRLEAEIPAQPRGRTLRYVFTVRTPLGETIRLPSGRADIPRRDGEGARAEASGPESAPGAPETAAAPVGESVPELGSDSYSLVVRAPVRQATLRIRGSGAALGLALVVTGIVVGGQRPSGPRRRRIGAALAAVGILAFAGAGIGGALAASYEATGNPLRDVPGAWWVALAAWIPGVLILLKVRSAEPARPRAVRAALLALATLGVLAVLLGLGDVV